MAETKAGPMERVGLMEQPSMGSKSKWTMKTAKPMAMQALFPEVDRGDTAVSHTTVDLK